MKHIDISVVFNIIVILFCIGVFGGIIGTGIANENNRIDSGIIVDRYYDAGYTRYSSDKNGGHMYSYPATYSFTIEGEKDGETVRYTFELTEQEYNTYKIGDYYER